MNVRLAPLLFACLAMPTAAMAGPASDAVQFFYIPEVKFAADAQYRDRFTEPVTKLFVLNDEAQKTNPDEVACIDFDPGLDAQDFDQSTVARTLKLSEKLTGDSGEVTATFQLFSEGEDSKREMVWSVRKIGDSWKIADIASKTNNWILSQTECVPGQGME